MLLLATEGIVVASVASINYYRELVSSLDDAPVPRALLRRLLLMVACKEGLGEGCDDLGHLRPIRPKL